MTTLISRGAHSEGDPTEQVMAEDSPLPVLEPLILIFDSLSWLKIFMIPMISLQKKKRKRKKISLFQNLNHHKFLTDLRYRFYYGISFAKTNSTVFLFPQLFFWEIVFLRNTFLDCYCNIQIWLIVWCMWVCNKSHIGYLLGRSGLY